MRVGGRAMVAWVLDALSATPGIDGTIVVAPEAALEHPALAAATQRRPAGKAIADSLASGLAGLPPDEPVLLCASDAPLLTPGALARFIAASAECDADLAYAIVERRVHIARYPDVPHTWARMREGIFCGGAAVTLRPRLLPALEGALARLAAARKSPRRLAGIFGWDILLRFALGRLSIAAAERRGSDLLGAPVTAIASPDPEIAFNVDRKADLARAERYLS